MLDPSACPIRPVSVRSAAGTTLKTDCVGGVRLREARFASCDGNGLFAAVLQALAIVGYGRLLPSIGWSPVCLWLWLTAFRPLWIVCCRGAVFSLPACERTVVDRCATACI